MLVDRPKLHPMAGAAIESLRKKGLTPTPAHIVWLQDAAMRIKRATAPRIGELIDWPIECGGMEFYRLSIVAMEWLARLPDRMQSDIFVQAFASAHSHDSSTLAGLSNPIKAYFHVRGWRSRLTASKDAIAGVLSQVMGADDVDDIPSAVPMRTSGTESEPTDYGAVVLALVRRFPGTTPQYWSVEVPHDQALDALAYSASSDALHGNEITMHAVFRSIVAAIEAELKAGPPHE